MTRRGRRYKDNYYDDFPGLFDEVEAPAAPIPELPGVKSSSPVEPDGPSLYYMSFGSGSSGNCAYIGDGTDGFLIDAGVDPTKVFDTLRHNGIKPDSIRGIILTHDHGDHVRYVYTFVRRHKHIAVYCTPKAFGGIMRRHSISRKLKDYHRPIYKEFPFKIGLFEITAFNVSHDGTDNSGYFISRGKHTFAIATDLGCITDRVEYYMDRARYIMIEANYDAHMLATGPYLPHLKARIAAESGHLDNAVGASFLARIYKPELRAVFLCHLSNDNNTPELAAATVRTALLKAHPEISIGDGTGSVETRDADLQLMPLPRFDASPMFRFR